MEEESLKVEEVEVVGINVKVGKEVGIEDVGVGFSILGEICFIFKNKNALTKINKIKINPKKIFFLIFL
jgi:hypothetical protein